MPATEFTFVRHGETAWNAEGRIQGHLDIPLNALGLTQAAALGQRLATESFHAIYSSDLQRAYGTAHPVAEKNGGVIHREARLRERHLGVLQGLTRDEAMARHPAAWAVFKSRRAADLLEGGESLGQFFRRITQLLGELCERHAGERVLLVTHGGVLDAAYRQVTGMSLSTPRDFPIRNASLNVLTHRERQWHIERWGDVGHLPGETSADG